MKTEQLHGGPLDGGEVMVGRCHGDGDRGVTVTDQRYRLLIGMGYATFGYHVYARAPDGKLRWALTEGQLVDGVESHP